MAHFTKVVFSDKNDLLLKAKTKDTPGAGPILDSHKENPYDEEILSEKIVESFNQHVVKTFTDLIKSTNEAIEFREKGDEKKVAARLSKNSRLSKKLQEIMRGDSPEFFFASALLFTMKNHGIMNKEKALSPVVIGSVVASNLLDDEEKQLLEDVQYIYSAIKNESKDDVLFDSLLKISVAYLKENEKTLEIVNSLDYITSLLKKNGYDVTVIDGAVGLYDY